MTRMITPPKDFLPSSHVRCGNLLLRKATHFVDASRVHLRISGLGVCLDAVHVCVCVAMTSLPVAVLPLPEICLMRLACLCADGVDVPLHLLPEMLALQLLILLAGGAGDADGMLFSVGSCPVTQNDILLAVEWLFLRSGNQEFQACSLVVRAPLAISQPLDVV